ncbi:MAG: transglutaminase [Clostridiales bacterium]|nr:transglutaminase [Clostridiales bacterium]
MFSKQKVEWAEKRFDEVISKASEEVRKEILTRLSEVKDKDVIFAIKWLYAYSPLSDMANYDFSLFKSYAEHAIFLRKNSPFCKEIPEGLFLNYVLYTRMGIEEICDCRKFFYDLLWQRVKGKSMHDAIVEVNYFNAENVMYIWTDYRTMSAINTYKTAYGRCGEESVFAVNVFRALGIPARQVYTPRWAHCDDNHAWVEVWCDGKWHFLGACEPEEVLNKGWFTNASGRAMLIHCRCFGMPLDDEEVISESDGFSYVVGNLDTYADTKKITVLVKGEDGKPVSGAKVSFAVLNHSYFYPAVVMQTNESGKVTLTVGKGSLNIHIQKGDVFCEHMIYTPDADTYEFVLKKDNIVYDEWTDFVSVAPADGIVKGNKPTEEQKELGRKKLAAANLKREKRVEAMFDSDRANKIVSKYGYSQKIYTVLKESRSNFESLLEFLEDQSFAPEQKEGLLLALSDKDWVDVDIDVLKEALECSKDYKADKDMLYPYIVNPRVWFEPLTCSRKFILKYFSDEQKEAFRAQPKKIWDYILDNFGFEPSFEYGNLVTNPVGLMRMKSGSRLSKKILFVTICRTLGIAARLNPVNQLAEYYDNGHYESVETLITEKGDSYIVLEKEEGENWQYEADFALTLLEQNNYRLLELGDVDWENNKLTANVKGGEYRIITDNRLPNGNLFASKYNFKLLPGETKTIKLRKYQADLSEMLYSYTLDEFKVCDSDGSLMRGSDLTKGSSVLMWLDEGAEPTEHILNEMLELESEFKALPADIIFMVRGKEALKNAKLQKVIGTFDKIKVYFDSFNPNVEIIARRLFLDPEKLPLIVVTKAPLCAVYACSGYNVGSGDMILKIAKFLNKQ